MQREGTVIAVNRYHRKVNIDAAERLGSGRFGSSTLYELGTLAQSV